MFAFRLCALGLLGSLAASAPAAPARAQLIPRSLPERLESGQMLERPLVASTPDGHTLVGSTRITDIAGTSLPAYVYDPNGTLLTQFTVASFDLNAGAAASEGVGRSGGRSGNFGVAGRANGDFLFVWARSADLGASSSIIARQFDRLGTPVTDELIVQAAQAGVSHHSPGATCNRVGRCVLSWVTRQASATVPSLLQLLVLADGFSSPPGDPLQLAPLGGLGAYTVAVADDGRIGVAYTQLRVTAPPAGAPTETFVTPRAQLYDALGGSLANLALGPEERVDNLGLASLLPAAAFNTAGDLLVAWTSTPAGGGLRVRARLLDVSGQPSGELTVLDDGTHSTREPALSWDSRSQRFAAAWISSGDPDDPQIGVLESVTLRLLDEHGAPLGEELVATTTPSAQFGHFLGSPALAVGGESSLRTAWLSTQNTDIVPPSDVMQVVFAAPPASCAPAAGGGRPVCVELGPAGRFRVSAAFRGSHGRSEPATLEAITPNAAFLFFQGQQNPEVVAKLLDGRTLNEHFWYFSGAMSNQEFAVSVLDQETGRSKVYFNPANQLRSLADTGTFNDDDLLATSAAETVAPALLSRGEALGPDFRRSLPATAASAGGCGTATATSLCLNQNRFRVEVVFRDLAGNLSLARAVQTTSDGGYFTFFNPNNVEVALKILDGTAINGQFWLFYASLSNVRFTVRIYRPDGSLARTYVNPRDTLESVADTGAF